MAKPTNTTGDRDYGRRTYASKKKYEEQRQLASDAHIDRILAFKRKHSEYKKPYLDDLGYPEMEMYNPPPPWWPPGIPPIPPTEGPPIDPGGPIPPLRPPPETPLPPFLGCNFFSRRIRPSTLQPGQIAYGGVDIGSQDSIKAIHIYGPGILGTNIAGCNESHKVKFSGYKEYSTNKGFCGISVKAKDDPRDFNHVTPYFTLPKDDPGPYPIVVEVIMASGSVCTEMLYLEACPADPPLEWDEDVAPATIGRSSYVNVAVKGGLPPYKWTISGTDFYIEFPETNENVNRVSTGAAACGTGRITVEDACGETVSGVIRCTAGAYTSVGVPQNWCPVSGPPDIGPGGADSTCPSGSVTRFLGAYKVHLCYAYAPPGSVDFSPCSEKPYCDCHYSLGAAPCHPALGCLLCIAIAWWQYLGAFADQGGACAQMGVQTGCWCLTSNYYLVEEWKC